jgi:hypothetical protein
MPEFTQKQKDVHDAWRKYNEAPGEDKTFRLSVAVNAAIAEAIERCVDEPARKDLHQGSPDVDEPIAKASLSSLYALYGETGVNEDQWHQLVLRLQKAELGHGRPELSQLEAMHYIMPGQTTGKTACGLDVVGRFGTSLLNVLTCRKCKDVIKEELG